VTSITQRLPVDEITRQASDIRVGRVLLTALAAVFFAIGWTVARVFLGVVWCAVAVKVGWQAGAARGKPAPAG
jgi:uncharacterized membrane protein YciS (DUF1049 family)